MYITQAFFRARSELSSSVIIPIEPKNRFETTLRTSKVLRFRVGYLLAWWVGTTVGTLPAAVIGEILLVRFNWDEFSLNYYTGLLFIVAISMALLRWYRRRPLPGERIIKSPLWHDESCQAVREERFYVWPLLQCSAKTTMVYSIILSAPLVGWNVFFV